MDFSYTQSDLEKLLSPKSVVGKTGSNITNISSLSDANKNSVSFLWNRKYRKDVAMSNAALLLLPESYDGAPKEDQCFFLTKNPSLALAKLCADIEEKYTKNIPVTIHESAVIDKTAKIGRNVSIGANSVIDANAIIGDNSTIGACSYIGRDVSVGNGTTIHNNVTIMNMCKIGDFVIIYSGCVIGSDGFGYETVNGEHVKLPQIGNVVIDYNRGFTTFKKKWFDDIWDSWKPPVLFIAVLVIGISAIIFIPYAIIDLVGWHLSPVSKTIELLTR